MKTEIFKTYSEFLNREDITLNGVSPEFAKENRIYKSDNAKNEACWNCRDCSYCRGLSWKDNITGYKTSEPTEQESVIATFAGYKIPIIPNIHQAILEAVTPPENTLQMPTWHTCGTTHCRAGWAVHLAGPEGYKLESMTDTCFAAMMIFKYSSPEVRIAPTRFFEDNETAYKDIVRCAELEAKLLTAVSQSKKPPTPNALRGTLTIG